jgi:S-adenosylmethionine-diacylglycerol 3-amino-3-carboxypropyl transferase
MRYVGEQDTGRLFLERFTRVATAIPTRGNFYLEYVMTGGYADLETGPPDLRPAVFASLPGLLPRLTVVHDEMEAYLEGEPPGSFSKANLSDVFEYMSEEATASLLARLCSRMRPGGRIAYWNLFVPRSRPADLADRLRPLTEEAAALFARDRAWFYGAFHVEEVS